MKKNNSKRLTNVVSSLVITLMLVMSFIVIAPSVAEAATQPQLTKTTRNILIGKSYNLNVVNKVKGSTYVWSTDDKAVATVDKRGVVKGISKGVTTITCAITTPKNTYDVTCKVTIRKGASSVAISNKVTALNLGQKYNLNRKLVSATSNDKVTWTTSDSNIATPDKNGKFTALNEGTVTITCTTLSGKSDTVTITVVDKAGTVTNQEELDALLGSGVALITMKTTDAVNFVIPGNDYSKQKLVVIAPNSDVTNSGTFASIEIQQIKSNTWYEEAVGNLLNILATDSRIVIAPGASVTIEVTKEGAVLKIENNGIIKEIAVQKKSDIDISGASKEDIPVTVNVPGITIKTSVPLNLACKQKIELVLEKGAEATTIQADSEAVVPTIKGDVTLSVTVGTGTTATKKTVIGAPIVTPATTVPSQNPGGNTVEEPNYKDYTISSWSALSSITVGYGGQTYTVSGPTLILVKSFLNATPGTITNWQDTTNSSLTYDGVTILVTGTSGSNMKTVKLTGGSFGTTGRTYTVTINPISNSVTITSSSKTFTVSYVNATTMRISPIPATLTFTEN